MVCVVLYDRYFGCLCAVTTGRSFGSGNTPVQPSPPYFPPFSPSWYSFANFFSGSQDTTPVEDYPEGPVTVPPFAEFSSASAPSSPASLLPALSPAEGAPAEGGTTGETVADGEVSASFVDSPPKRRRISPSTLQPLKFRPLGAAAAPLAAASPAFETGGGAPGADWGLQRQTSGLWSEAGSDALRAVVTHPGAITLSAVATAAAALVVGTRLWRVWRSRGRRSEHLLDAHTASWDLGRCLLLVDVAAARESGALRGSFVPGSAQVSVNWAHQLATISFKFIPSASKGLFSFIARRGVRAHQRFRVPMEDCFISPQREKAESGEAFLLAEGAAAGGGFFDEAAASKSSSLASTTAAADWSESGSATLAKKGALLSQPRSNSNKKRGGGPRAEDLARLDPASFVREHVQRSIFGSKTTALVVKFDANPGPAPLQRLPNPHATLPPSLVQRVQEQLALPSAPDVQLEGEAPVGAEEKRRALSGLLPRRPPHAKQSRLSYVAAWDSAVSDALCSWDLAVDDSQPLGVWADLATQTLFVAQAPETSGGCLHALRGKFGRAAPNASGVLFHEIPLSEACALASTAHAGFSVAFVRVPFQETLLSAPKTAAADNAAPAQRTAESPRAIQSAETGAAAAAKSDSFNQQAGEASGGGFRLFQHVRIELRPCPRAFHKRTLPKLAPKVVGD